MWVQTALLACMFLVRFAFGLVPQKAPSHLFFLSSLLFGFSLSRKSQMSPKIFGRPCTGEAIRLMCKISSPRCLTRFQLQCPGHTAFCNHKYWISLAVCWSAKKPTLWRGCFSFSVLSKRLFLLQKRGVVNPWQLFISLQAFFFFPPNEIS